MHNVLRQLLFVVLPLMPLVLTGCGSQVETPSCDTPPLEELKAVLLSDDAEAKDRLFAQDLLPRIAHSEATPPEMQRCLIEIFLEAPPMYGPQGFNKNAIEANFGALPFYTFHQPEYLERKLLRLPSTLLVRTYGREVVPLVVEHASSFVYTDEIMNLARLAREILVLAERHQLPLEPEEKEKLERVLKVHRLDQALDPPFRHAWSLKGIKDELCGGSQASRIHVLEDMVVLDLPETRGVLEELLDKETHEVLRGYVRDLLQFQRGETEALPWLTYEIAYHAGLGYYSVPMVDLEICEGWSW